MKAIILSAGQGKRLFPLTEDTPKCLLSLGSTGSVLSWQLAQLARAGFDDIVIVTGYRADLVEQEVARCSSFANARTVYNPDYACADNLRSVWHARHEMDEDFILLNGDTLFSQDVLECLVSQPARPITVTTSRKDRYDADDMKVQLKNGLLHRIGKTLDLAAVDAESIGMLRFMGKGRSLFKGAMEEVLSSERGNRVWYLSVIDQIAKQSPVHTVDVGASSWCEVDFPVDLQRARQSVAAWCAAEQAVAAAS